MSRDLDGILVHAALPGLSGFALCRLAKERDPTMPVVLMFSAEDSRGESEAKRAGADNWLVRPLKRLELLYVVRDMVNLRGTYMRAARTAAERDQSRSEAISIQGANADSSPLVQFELFKRILGIELKRSQRYGFPLGLLIATLDKEPAAQDRDLLAGAARTAIRDIDIPVAFGETSLLVAMPHTDLEGARLVAERIRKRVRSVSHSRPGDTLTTSIGVVCTDGSERLSFAAMLAQATRAQRTATKQGGDRIVAS
jgi:diguanylate cyclase (GGDEF)-like protein